MIGLVALAAAAATGPGRLGRCDPPPGWDAVAARGAHYVILGEAHGTAEAPALVGDIACALAVRGERLLVAIEQRSADDAALQAAWALPPSRFAAALRRLRWWREDGDGRGSAATFAMLVRLHALRAGGRRIDIVAFQDEAEQRARFAGLPGQGPMEAAKADNIRRADAGGHDRVLVLTGNVHAAKQPITRGSVTFEPMAMRLGPAAAITSLLMRTAGGEAWNCQLRAGFRPVPGQPVTTAAMDCAGHPLAPDAALSGPPSLGLGAAPGASANPAYDGWFWLGRVSASPPAQP